MDGALHQSRVPGSFQPISPIFSQSGNHSDCHYCGDDKRVKGMTEEKARRAIDWLETTPGGYWLPREENRCET